MSYPTEIAGIADADLVTSGGRGHLVQSDGSSNERIDLVTASDSGTILGALKNNNADTAGDIADIVFAGFVDGVAGEALEPFDEVIALSDSEFGKYVPGSGHVPVGMYIPARAGGATNLPDVAATRDCRVYLYAQKAARNDASGSLKVVYDFDVDGGAIGSIGTGVFLPDNAVVYLSAIEVLTTCTSAGDTATIAITSADVTVDAAIAINDGTNPWDAGLRVGDHTATSTTWEKTTSRQEISFVIAVQAVTAGKIVAYLDYRLSE